VPVFFQIIGPAPQEPCAIPRGASDLSRQCHGWEENMHRKYKKRAWKHFITSSRSKAIVISRVISKLPLPRTMTPLHRILAYQEVQTHIHIMIENVLLTALYYLQFICAIRDFMNGTFCPRKGTAMKTFVVSRIERSVKTFDIPRWNLTSEKGTYGSIQTLT
jgi:hypothetical protein